MNLSTKFALFLIAGSGIGAIALVTSMDSVDWGSRNCIAEIGDEADRCRRLDEALSPSSDFVRAGADCQGSRGQRHPFDQAFEALRLEQMSS